MVQESASLFAVLFLHSSYGETNVISPTSHCLQLLGDGISSEILPDVFLSGQDLSFALLVKPHPGQGVVMSYGQFILFGLMHNNSMLQVVVNGTVHDTGLTLHVQAWNELVVVYTAAVFRFDIYIHTEGMVYTNHVVVSEAFIFETHGVLTVGGWTQVQGSRSWSLPGVTGLMGEVDEFRVWQRAVTYTEITSSWNDNKLFASTAVFVHWTMNEGQGSVTVDRIRHYRFTFYRYDWTQTTVRWHISSLVMAHPVIPATHSFMDADLLRQADTQCRSAVFSTSLSSHCGTIHTALAQFYFAVCLSDAAAVDNHVSTSLTVVLSLSDYCQTSLQLPSWPAQALCTLFPNLPRFGGPACAVECLFGTVGVDVNVKNQAGNATQVCLCRAGFWGSRCGSTCPGGVASVCGGRGECTRDGGECVCQQGWSGAACSQCATGWKGSDCSVAVQTPSRSPFCSFTLNSHLMTLDGAGMTFAEAGIFSLLEDSSLSLKIDIQSRPCRNFRSCVAQAAVEISGHTVMLDALNTSHAIVDRAARLISPEIVVTSDVKVVALDRLSLEIQHSSGFTASVFFREAFLDVHLTLSTSCTSAGGLCGRCQPGATTSCSNTNHTCLVRALGVARYLQTYTTTAHTTIHTYLKSWAREFSVSVFSRATIPNTVTAGPTSFAVSLTTGGYIVTAPLPARILTSSQLTFSVSLRISPTTNLTSAVLWSYAKTHLFAVLVQQGRLALYVNGTVTHTTIDVHMDVWSQVSLVYHGQRGVCVLHYLRLEGGVNTVHHYQVIRVGVGVLPVGGALAIATWQTAIVTASRPVVSLVISPYF
jgi:hypothetical protein